MLAAISYDPIVHIPIGPLQISPHGMGIAVGFLLGARLMLPESRRKGIADDHVYAILVRAAIGAMIGARVAYVVNHFGDYTDAPLDILKVWEGGISLLGGIFGAILLALPLIRKLRIDTWKLLDSAAPGIALGIIVGRIGDLVVGDHLGKPTDFFLGYRCPIDPEATASPCVADVVHQTALYDLLLTSLLLGLLLVLRGRARRAAIDGEDGPFDGFLLMVFGAWYGVGRIIEDFLREDVRRLGLTGSQWTAVATVVVCVAWLVVVRRAPRWGRWADADADTEPDAEHAGQEPPDAVPTMAEPREPVEPVEPQEER